MNKQIVFDKLGGFPFDQQTLEFMQESYVSVAGALSTLCGDNVILSGVIRTGKTISNGWIIYNGELFPFKGTAAPTDTFTITELKEAVRFEDTQDKEVYITRYAECVTSGIPLAQLTRLNTLLTTQAGLKDLKKYIQEFREHYDTNVITCYYDLTLDARASSKSIALFSPQGGDANGDEHFGRKYGAMNNYIVIKCDNIDYTSEQLHWTLKPVGNTDNTVDHVMLYAERMGNYSAEIKTRLWYVLVHKNFKTPLLGNSTVPVF